MIIRNGENISAKEVEDLLFDHPDIADVAVFGLPDERTGEKVCAVLVAEADATPSVESVARFLREAGLRSPALPERVELIEALPRNPAGKVLKRHLQHTYG